MFWSLHTCKTQQNTQHIHTYTHTHTHTHMRTCTHSAEARKRSNGDTELESHFVQHDVNEEELPPFVSLQQEEGTEQPMMSEATESISTNKQMKGEAPHNQSSAASDLTAQSSKTNLLEGDELNMADSGLSWL